MFDGRRSTRAGRTGPRSKALTARLRPGERVTQYLLEQAERAGVSGHSRLPTVRELAARLNVSVFTVHSVFQKLKGVGRIRTEVGNGTFLVPPPTDDRSPVFKIGLNVPFEREPLGGSWSYRIAQGILRAAAAGPRRGMVRPLPSPGPGDDHRAGQWRDECALVDGLILFPSPFAAQVVNASRQAGKPVVMINPPSLGATADFVSSDYYDISFRLGRAWKETGRRRIAFVAEQSMNVSTCLRWFGLIAGLELDGRGEVALQVFKAGSVLEEDGYQAIQPALAGDGAMPDAVCCTGDLLALGVARALAERGRRIPTDTSIAGGTGMDLAGVSQPRLTRTQHPFDDLGEAAFTMLCEKIESGGAARPGRVFPARWIGGATTRPEENDLLEIAP